MNSTVAWDVTPCATAVIHIEVSIGAYGDAVFNPREGAMLEESNSISALRLDLPQAELCERLRRGVERAAARDADSIDALRAAVCEFTVVLKERGTTPEGVLISLKALIADQTFSLIPPHPSDSSGYKVREQMSTWAIREFFREPNG